MILYPSLNFIQERLQVQCIPATIHTAVSFFDVGNELTTKKVFLLNGLERVVYSYQFFLNTCTFGVISISTYLRHIIVNNMTFVLMTESLTEY